MEKKEKKRCPVCGARMKDGKCRWCGHEEIVEEIPIDESLITLVEEDKTEEDDGPQSYPWWTEKWVTILLLIFCFPAGIIAMYGYGHFRPWVRDTVTICLIVLTVLFCVFIIPCSPVAATYTVVPGYGEPVVEAPEPVPGDEEILSRAVDEALSRKRTVGYLVEAGHSEEDASLIADAAGIDWKANALESADLCVNGLMMSERAAYEQLTSEYGEGFLPEEAGWALLNIEADWLSNAIARAEAFRELGKSREETLRLLTSEYGDMFGKDDAEKAVAEVWK